MAKRRSRSYSSQKTFAKEVLITMAGVGVGAAVDKIVTESLAKAGIQNPSFSTIKATDAVLVGAELVGAYKLKTKKPKATKFLIGMASAVVATDIVEAFGTTPWIIGARNFGNTPRVANYGQGSYNRTAPKTGPIGAYLKPPMWAYAPR